MPSLELIALPAFEVHWLYRFFTSVNTLCIDNPAFEALVDEAYDDADPEMIDDCWNTFLEDIPHRFFFTATLEETE